MSTWVACRQFQIQGKLSLRVEYLALLRQDTTLAGEAAVTWLVARYNPGGGSSGNVAGGNIVSIDGSPDASLPSVTLRRQASKPSGALPEVQTVLVISIPLSVRYWITSIIHKMLLKFSTGHIWVEFACIELVDVHWSTAPADCIVAFAYATAGWHVKTLKSSFFPALPYWVGHNMHSI
eukprot:3323498-Amphidinium_carterae.1